jgi:hypothetical protein
VSLRRYAAITTLFIIPSIIVEFLSGNTTFAALRNPPGPIMMVAEYGSGAILARELARTWQRGFAPILILGAVYGMFNEGIGTGGFFDPNFYSVVEWGLKDYGRWGGINVVWALRIIVFHAVFSITIPIIIVDALFPNFADRRLLGNKSLVAFFVILVAITTLQRAIISQWQPPISLYAFVLMIVLMLLLTVAARRFPSFDTLSARRMPSDKILFISGLVGSFTWIAVIPWILSLIHLPIVDVLTVCGLVLVVSLFLLSFADVSNRQRVALATGAEGPLLAHAIASELFVPAAITLALLVLAWRRSTSKIASRAPMLCSLLFADAAVAVAVSTAVLLRRSFT